MLSFCTSTSSLSLSLSLPIGALNNKVLWVYIMENFKFTPFLVKFTPFLRVVVKKRGRPAGLRTRQARPGCEFNQKRCELKNFLYYSLKHFATLQPGFSFQFF